MAFSPWEKPRVLIYPCVRHDPLPWLSWQLGYPYPDRWDKSICLWDHYCRIRQPQCNGIARKIGWHRARGTVCSPSKRSKKAKKQRKHSNPHLITHLHPIWPMAWFKGDLFHHITAIALVICQWRQSGFSAPFLCGLRKSVWHNNGSSSIIASSISQQERKQGSSLLYCAVCKDKDCAESQSSNRANNSPQRFWCRHHHGQSINQFILSLTKDKPRTKYLSGCLVHGALLISFLEFSRSFSLKDFFAHPWMRTKMTVLYCPIINTIELFWNRQKWKNSSAVQTSRTFTNDTSQKQSTMQGEATAHL